MPILETVYSVDAILVLGRGIEADGALSPASLERAEMAVGLARLLMPRVVVFSGGRSWRQAASGITPPSEGGAMLEHANTCMVDHRPEGVRFVSEEESESTVGNMAKSQRLLGLSRGERLGILSDELHFLYGRPDFIAAKVFPGVAVQRLTIPGEYDTAARREERLATWATKIALAGVRSGNESAIMRRQRRLDCANRFLRG